jgi:hypothetical protein
VETKDSPAARATLGKIAALAGAYPYQKSQALLDSGRLYAAEQNYAAARAEFAEVETPDFTTADRATGRGTPHGFLYSRTRLLHTVLARGGWPAGR